MKNQRKGLSKLSSNIFTKEAESKELSSPIMYQIKLEVFCQKMHTILIMALIKQFIQLRKMQND